MNCLVQIDRYHLSQPTLLPYNKVLKRQSGWHDKSEK